MKEIEEYIFLRCNSVRELREGINDLVADGYQPYEGPLMHIDGHDGDVYAQAMVKYKAEE